MWMKKFDLEDVNAISYDEFGRLMEKLVTDIKNFSEQNAMTFHAVAPILRNGAIPGTIIANKLLILSYLPVYVKYFYKPTRQEQLLPFQKTINFDLPEDLNILVTESNTFSGGSAKKAYEIIKNAYSAANLYCATITRVYRKEAVNLDMYTHYFYGVMTNEGFEADESTAQKLQLRSGITVFPWETPEHELQETNDALEG